MKNGSTKFTHALYLFDHLNRTTFIKFVVKRRIIFLGLDRKILTSGCQVGFPRAYDSVMSSVWEREWW